MVSQTDIHSMKLLDLPSMLRLKQNAIVLDSEMGLINDARGQNSALLSSIVFPRGLHTLLAHLDSSDVVGQFRHRQGDVNAHLVYLAPALADADDDTIWLHMLDAMAEHAGRNGAQTLVGEVELSHRLFETMRQAGYAVYSRQVVWRRGPVADAFAASALALTPESADDETGIAALLGCTIPRILQSVMAPSTEMTGLVYRKKGQVEAYLAYSEGKHGVYILPFLHPEVLSEAAEIVAAGLARIDRCRKLPVYICVRGYQGWLENAMRDLGFSPWLEQAVMVKHLTAGIRQASFERVQLGSAGRRKAATSLRLAGHNGIDKAVRHAYHDHLGF